MVRRWQLGGQLCARLLPSAQARLITQCRLSVVTEV